MGRKARDKQQRPSAPVRPEGMSAPPSPPPRAPRSARASSGYSWKTAAWALLLVAATLAAYWNALGNPFLLDDPTNITKNARIQKPLSLYALTADPRAFVTASLRWNYASGGESVTGYHLLNAVAHALTGLLVFAFARTTLRLDVFGGRYDKVGETLAGIAALVFLLHPMQTESVAYIIQRSEIFVSAALVGTLISLVAIRDGRFSAGMAGLAASCVLGVYSKPMFAVAPALMLLYDLCFLSRGDRRELASRWPAYALATAAAVATFVLTHFAGSFENETAGFDIEGITPGGYLAAQFGVIVHYLRKVVWPAGLCFDCGYRGPWPVLPTFLGDSIVLPLAILAVLGGAALAAWRRQPLFAFAFFGMAVVLAPSSSVVPLADFYVEHRMYLAIGFLGLALVATIHDALARLSLPPKSVAVAGLASAALLVSTLAYATVQRNRVLGNPVTLMEQALEQAPQSERLHYNLANAYKRDGRLDDAVPHYREAIRLLPNIIRSYQNLGSLYLQQGKLEEALDVYLAGAKAKPNVSMGHRNVANAYLKLGRAEEALAAAEKSLELEPGNPNGLRLAAEARQQLGRAN